MSTRFAVVLFILLAPTISFAANGALYMSPAHGTYTMDSVFEVDVKADTDGESANAAEADISFNPEALTVEKISTDGSVLSLWPTPPEFSNTKGTVRFSGTASGSFTGRDAVLIRIMFRATSAQPGDIRIDSGALLKNDARATNIITSMRSGLYTIVAHQAPPLPEAAAEVATDSPVASPEVKGASIQVPTISAFDDRVAPGSRIALHGTAAENASINIFVQHNDETPQESAIRATSDGTYTYVSAEPAASGVYHAWAQVHGDTESFSSDKVTVTVASAGFASAALASGPILVATLLAVLIGVAGVFVYSSVRRGSRGA